MKKISLFIVLSFLFVVSFVNAQEVPLPGPPAPQVTIIEPATEAELPIRQDVTLTFSVENFVFVDFKNNTEPHPSGPNAGHAHLWVDDVSYSHDAARKLLSTDPVVLGTLERGTHTVVIELSGNDHSVYDPPARASIEFRVGSGGLSGLLGAGGGGFGALVLLILALAGFFIGWRKRGQLRSYLQKMMKK